jgi:hypothetical protein
MKNQYLDYDRDSLDILLKEATKQSLVAIDEAKGTNLLADLDKVETALNAVETIGETFDFLKRPNMVMGGKGNNLSLVRNDLETLQHDILEEQRKHREAITTRDHAQQRLTAIGEALKTRDNIESRLNGKCFGMFGKPFGHDLKKWTRTEYDTAIKKAQYDNPSSGGTERQAAQAALATDLEQAKNDIKVWVEDNAVTTAGIGELSLSSKQFGSAKGVVLYRTVKAFNGKQISKADKDAKILRLWHDEKYIQNILRDLGVSMDGGAFLPSSRWDLDEKGNVTGRQFENEFLNEPMTMTIKI